MRTLSIVCLLLVGAVAVDLAAATREPDAYDQLSLELINRARANPQAEADRLEGYSEYGNPAYDGNLNEGLTPGTISTAAKQPLAFNPHLVYSAWQHTTWMYLHSVFSHYEGGLLDEPADRVQAAGYVFLPSQSGVGENLAGRFYSSSQDKATVTATMQAQLFVDAGVTGRGHRLNLMHADWREVGINVGGPAAFTYSGTTYNFSYLQTQDFAYSGAPLANHFLTGVAYDDDNGTDDDFYTPGEGLGGVTIAAIRTNGTVAGTTTTWDSGGYSLQLAPGTYQVRAFGGDLDGIVVIDNTVLGTVNLKLDIDPTTAASVRSIRMAVQPDHVWTCSPTAPVDTDETTHRVFEGLESAEDHVLALSPMAPG